MEEQERKEFASDLNSVKDELQKLITTKINNIETKEINQKLEKEKIDITFKKPSFFLAFKNLKVISFSNVEINLKLFVLL